MNIQINKQFFIFFLLFANMKAIGQIKVDTTNSCYFNDFLKETQIVEDITITNNSEEEYLTWIARFPSADKSNSFLVNRFFFSRIGDFRLFDLMYDNIYYEIKFNIPHTFIKKIPQGESFTYVIMKENEKTDFYSKRIVIISRKEVEDYLGQAIREEFFFPMSRICLSEKND